MGNSIVCNSMNLEINFSETVLITTLLLSRILKIEIKSINVFGRMIGARRGQLKTTGVLIPRTN